MSRKRCVRRHWNLMNPITLAMSGASITPEHDLDRLRVVELSAIDSLSKGVGTPEDFRALCDMLNLAQTMAEQGIGVEVLAAAEIAERHMLATKERHDRTGKLGLTGEGLQSLRDLFEYHDLQRQSIDRATYERAIQRTMNRIRSAHPSVKELA